MKLVHEWIGTIPVLKFIVLPTRERLTDVPRGPCQDPYLNKLAFDALSDDKLLPNVGDMLLVNKAAVFESLYPWPRWYFHTVNINLAEDHITLNELDSAVVVGTGAASLRKGDDFIVPFFKLYSVHRGFGSIHPLDVFESFRIVSAGSSS